MELYLSDCMYVFAVKIYQTLLDTGYTYDENQFMERMYIPDMEAPPPIPPKKRQRKKQADAKVPLSSARSPPSSVQGDSPRCGEKSNRGSSASAGDDLAWYGACGAVLYSIYSVVYMEL